jgi:hypothetical protein
MAQARAKELNVREHLGTPTDLRPEATRDISAALSALLADTPLFEDQELSLAYERAALTW